MACHRSGAYLEFGNEPDFYYSEEKDWCLAAYVIGEFSCVQPLHASHKTAELHAARLFAKDWMERAGVNHALRDIEAVIDLYQAQKTTKLYVCYKRNDI